MAWFIGSIAFPEVLVVSFFLPLILRCCFLFLWGFRSGVEVSSFIDSIGDSSSSSEGLDGICSRLVSGSLDRVEFIEFLSVGVSSGPVLFSTWLTLVRSFLSSFAMAGVSAFFDGGIHICEYWALDYLVGLGPCFYTRG